MQSREILACLVVAAAWLSLPHATSAASSGLYPPSELTKAAPRLERAVNGIYTKGIAPALTGRERSGLTGVRFDFPMPAPDDLVLNFYAGEINGERTVVLPVQSLKLLEDLTTAFAWAYVNKQSFAPLDLYFAMLERKGPAGLGGVGKRDILSVVGVPANALSDKKVDRLSLSLRNEAFAFILLHELGHLLYRHKGLADITAPQARADEEQSDAFALDVMARTGTPPLGAVLFFQAQIYALPHRGQYLTPAAWNAYLETASTHPLSVDRVRAMAEMTRGPLAARQTRDRAIWRDIGSKLDAVSDILADVELHNCMTKVAARAPVSILRDAGKSEPAAIRQFCR